MLSNETEVLLDSWNRQLSIFNSLAGIITDENAELQASPESWPIREHLCHVHNTRKWWLKQAAPHLVENIGKSYKQVGEEWVPLDDLDEIRSLLDASGKAVGDAVKEAMEAGGGKFGPYDHPFIFLQHMYWHEGYHYGVITLALRNAGQEPDEAWQEKHIWELFRGPEEY
jgi:uncharacterized damage-inducible protein DinB